MELELRFFATYREVAGEKTVFREWADGATVGDVLDDLGEEHPDMDLFEDDGSIREFITVMKNGKDVAHLDGRETDLADGDALSIFPPVAGG